MKNIYTFNATIKDEYSAYVMERKVESVASNYIEACAKISELKGLQDYKLIPGIRQPNTKESEQTR